MSQIQINKEICYSDSESSEVWSRNEKGFLEVKIEWKKDVLIAYKEKFQEKKKNIKKLKKEKPLNNQDFIEKTSFDINNFFEI